MTDPDRLAEIKADLETGRDTSSVQQWWLVGEVERLRGLLARLEWVGPCDGGVRECGVCPVCREHREGGGHGPGCWLAAELHREGVDP